MIDFACKKFELNEIMKCAFGLTRSEASLLEKIKRKSWMTADEIAKICGLHLSTVQRAMKKLNEKGVMLRKQTNLDSGYVYSYKMRSLEEIRKAIVKNLKEWERDIFNELSRWS